jgi:hypothetical protein
MRRLLIAVLCAALSGCASDSFNFLTSRREVRLHAGDAEKLNLDSEKTFVASSWTCSDPTRVEVLSNGWIIGLKPGVVSIVANSAGKHKGPGWTIRVLPPVQQFRNPEHLKQFPDNRRFEADGRVCFGSELNGHVLGVPHHGVLRSNRIINPEPPATDRNVLWQIAPNTVVVDGTGVPLGVVANEPHGNRKFPGAAFNYGMSKIIRGRLYLYCFATDIVPDARVRNQMDQSQMINGRLTTSAWLPFDSVVGKETLIERFGVNLGKLPAVPLEPSIVYRITGGNPSAYQTPYGELAIVKELNGPLPSHYLRRPSGTINVLYSVPGFGLGGQGLDAFLVTDRLVFRPAVAAIRSFVQPTYYPRRHPKASQVSPKTMTFIYGAVEAPGCEPVFGWVAREALAPK